MILLLFITDLKPLNEAFCLFVKKIFLPNVCLTFAVLIFFCRHVTTLLDKPYICGRIFKILDYGKRKCKCRVGAHPD